MTNEEYIFKKLMEFENNPVVKMKNSLEAEKKLAFKELQTFMFKEALNEDINLEDMYVAQANFHEAERKLKEFLNSPCEEE